LFFFINKSNAHLHQFKMTNVDAFLPKTVIKDQIMSNNTKWFKHRYVRSIKITKHQHTVICQKMKPFCTFSYSKAEVGRGKVPNVWLYGPGCYVILVWRGIALVTARCLMGGYLSAHWFTGWRLKWWQLAIDGLTATENEENRLKPQLLCDSSILPSPLPHVIASIFISLIISSASETWCFYRLFWPKWLKNWSRQSSTQRNDINNKWMKLKISSLLLLLQDCSMWLVTGEKLLLLFIVKVQTVYSV